MFTEKRTGGIDVKMFLVIGDFLKIIITYYKVNVHCSGYLINIWLVVLIQSSLGYRPVYIPTIPCPPPKDSQNQVCMNQEFGGGGLRSEAGAQEGFEGRWEGGGGAGQGEEEAELWGICLCGAQRTRHAAQT